MKLQEHEFSDAQRKRRDDEIWNAAIEEAAQISDEYEQQELASAIRDIKRSTP